MNANVASIRSEGLALEIRPGVALRERVIGRGTLYYLSLFDDEIDERCGRFLDRHGAVLGASGMEAFAEIENAASSLELTDVVVSCQKSTIAVARGAACTIPFFWTQEGMGVRLSTALPVLGGAKFSQVGLASVMAEVCLPGSYEPNAWTETPLDAWKRVRRGAVTTFKHGSMFREEAIVHRLAPEDGWADRDQIAQRVRTAFTYYRQLQRHVTSSVIELSGGFDSTLAAAAAITPHHTMRGISAEFPYYEFRFEAAVQQAVGDALGISRTVLDGTQMFPYAPWETPPRFDEPALFVTGIRHAEQVAGIAAAHNASRIYMGHGGDQLFSTDLTANETVSGAPERSPFSGTTWRTIKNAIAQIRQSKWLHRSTGCFVYDARQDVWVKETFGATIRTPFSDLDLFRAAQMWSQWSAARGGRPDKTILSAALGDLIPQAVVRRKGKVAYDGVWMRSYAANAEHIGRTFEKASPTLERIGISTAWLLRRVDQLARWQPVSDREVLGAYALAVWLLSWGIEKAPDMVCE